jgi:hypothetical protein
MAMPGFSAEASIYKSGRYYCHTNASGLDSTVWVGPTSNLEVATDSRIQSSRAGPQRASTVYEQCGVCEVNLSDEGCAWGKPADSPCGGSDVVDSTPLLAGQVMPAACVMNSQGQLCCTQPDGTVKCSVPLTTRCPVGQCPAGQTCCGGICCPEGNCCSDTCCSTAQICSNGCCVTSGTSGSLGGFTNVLFTAASRCQNILGLTVSVELTQELFAADGFSIQLNAYNPVGPPTSWMQYVLMVNGDQVGARIEYWDIAQFDACLQSTPAFLQSIICSAAMTFNNPNIFGVQWWPAPDGATIPNLTLPGTNTITAGSVLTIALQNDSSGNITGANFSVTDVLGNTFPLTLSVDQDVQAPIVAFELNIVGYDNGQPTTFSSGAGLITYEAQNGLCVEGVLPDICSMSAASGTGTAENSNITYEAISAPNCCGPSVQQSFQTPS